MRQLTTNKFCIRCNRGSCNHCLLRSTRLDAVGRHFLLGYDSPAQHYAAWIVEQKLAS